VTYLVRNYDIDTYRPNLFEAFIRKSMVLCKKRALHSFIVPDRITTNEQYIPLRKLLGEENKVLSLYFNIKFPDVIADTIVYVIEKSKAREYDVKISKFPSTHFYKLPFKLYKQLVDKAFFYVDEEIYKLFFEKISKNTKYLNSFVNSNVGFIAKAGLITSKKENDNQERVIKGDCFFRYLLTKAWWFEFKKQNLAGGT
jgi:adenine-specific DNA-methyltransferase